MLKRSTQEWRIELVYSVHNTIAEVMGGVNIEK
jgi:hypothetical protein